VCSRQRRRELSLGWFLGGMKALGEVDRAEGVGASVKGIWCVVEPDGREAA
jgi:hypothetical protein